MQKVEYYKVSCGESGDFLASGIIGCEESGSELGCLQGAEASESERRLDILRTHPHHPRVLGTEDTAVG